MPDESNELIEPTIPDDDSSLFANFSPGDEPTLLLSEAQQSLAEFYVEPYQIEVAYEERTGIVPMPVADADGVAAVCVKLCGNYWLKRVRWSAKRINSKPALPHWDTNNDNEVLISKTIVPQKPQVMRNGQAFIYEVKGEYVYMLQYPPNLDVDSIAVATSPMETVAASVHAITPAQFDDTILTCDPPSTYVAP